MILQPDLLPVVGTFLGKAFADLTPAERFQALRHVEKLLAGPGLPASEIEKAEVRRQLMESGPVEVPKGANTHPTHPDDAHDAHDAHTAEAPAETPGDALALIEQAIERLHPLRDQGLEHARTLLSLEAARHSLRAARGL